MNLAHVIQADDYRVTECDGGYEPQIRYPIGEHSKWIAINASGYWADPDDWNRAFHGQPLIGSAVMNTRAEADAAVAKARRINGDLPKAV